MIKIRMELDELLENKDLHFTLNGSRQLTIAGKCGETFVTFYDIELSKNPTKKELEFVKNTLLKDIDNINDKIDELIRLKDVRPKPIGLDGYYGNYYLMLEDTKDRVYITEDTLEPISYQVHFKDKKEIDEILTRLNDKIEEYKIYKEWNEEYDAISNELNKCNI